LNQQKGEHDESTLVIKYVYGLIGKNGGKKMGTPGATYRNVVDCMRDHLKAYGGSLYKIRPEYRSEMLHGLPNRVSEPFSLHPRDEKKIQKLGRVLWNFIDASHKMYMCDDLFKSIIDFGKPTSMRSWKKEDAPFLKVDLGLTIDGLKLYEFTYNPNGLAIMELINRTYQDCGEYTAVPRDRMKDYFSSIFPTNGSVAFTYNEIQYTGEYKYLAKEVLPANWDIKLMSYHSTQTKPTILRAWQTWEEESCPYLQGLEGTVFPSSHHLDSKVLMGLFYHDSFRGMYESLLEEADFEFLENILPLTVLLNQYKNYSHGVSFTSDIPNIPSLSAGDRQGVLKLADSSGCHAVHFLNSLNRGECSAYMANAMNDTKNHWIVQDFHRAVKRSLHYFGGNGRIEEMEARTVLRLV
jgi:hypothetical protein